MALQARLEMLILLDGMPRLLNYVNVLDGEDSPLQSVLFLSWFWRWHGMLNRALRINEIQDSGTRTATSPFFRSRVPHS